jgi:hypothetical protein
MTIKKSSAQHPERGLSQAAAVFLAGYHPICHTTATNHVCALNGMGSPDR